MKRCPTPNCGTALADNATICNDCGWEAPKQPRANALPDPFHLICSHVSQGQRCAEAGTLSENTRGAGPWYCHKHFPPFAGRYSGKPTPPPQGFEALKSVLRRVEIDPEDAAERQAIREEGA